MKSNPKSRPKKHTEHQEEIKKEENPNADKKEDEILCPVCTLKKEIGNHILPNRSLLDPREWSWDEKRLVMLSASTAGICSALLQHFMK